MSSESFHPTLVAKGFVTDEHREYADWARRTYRSVDDIPGINNEPLTAELASGDMVRYFVNQPNIQLPDNRQDGLLVRRHPFANGNTPHMHIWAQVMADITGMRVLSLPNNIGKEKFEHLSPGTKIAIHQLGFRAIANVHAEVVENEMIGSENIFPFGWSEGGSAAAALAAVSKNRFYVRRAGVGDPANSIDRSSLQLLRDFTKETGESFSEAAKRADLPALNKALNLYDDETRKKNGHRWIKNLVLYPPIARIQLLKEDTVYDDIEDGLSAHEGSEALVFTGELSPVAPVEEVSWRIEQMQRKVGSKALSHLVLEDAGHGAADQIFDQAVIANYVTAA